MQMVARFRSGNDFGVDKFFTFCLEIFQGPVYAKN